MENLQAIAETAWEEFRARYHRILDVSKSGADGSTGLNGHGILQVRSASHRVATSVLYATELLNGSGEAPDTNALLSFAEREGQSAEDFTCTVLSLMFIMDGLYSIHSGKSDMVVQLFDAFMKAEEQPITLESTPLKTPGLEVTTQSPGEVPVSQGGESFKSESTRMSQQRTKKKLVKGSGRPSTSGRRKAPTKK